MFPTKSFGVRISAVTKGSSIYDISFGAGRSDGLYNSITSPSVLYTLYITDGDVVIKLKSNSLSNHFHLLDIVHNTPLDLLFYIQEVAL